MRQSNNAIAKNVAMIGGPENLDDLLLVPSAAIQDGIRALKSQGGEVEKKRSKLEAG